ncbi:MAG: hypothetical protein ACR2PH_00280, partial [Desulfobulbia bacterium]
LKGVAASVGAETLSGCCAILEKQAEAQDVKQADIDAAESALSMVLNSLAKLEAPGSLADNGAELDRDALGPLLDELVQQLEGFDTGAMEIIESNRALFFAEPLATPSKKLEKALEGYDFETALAVAKDMQQSVQIDEDGPLSDADREDLAGVLKHLHALLNDFNADAGEYLENNEALFKKGALQLEWKSIHDALEKYDFTKAAAIIGKITEKLNITL